MINIIMWVINQSKKDQIVSERIFKIVYYVV